MDVWNADGKGFCAFIRHGSGFIAASYIDIYIYVQPNRNSYLQLVTSSSPRSSLFPMEAPRDAGKYSNYIRKRNVHQNRLFTSSSQHQLGPHSIVEYSSPEEAQKAISQLTNKELEGRQVFVREVSSYYNAARQRLVLDHG